MKLHFSGEVECGDACRCDDEIPPGALKIGGRDVVEEVSEANWDGPVTVAFADERWEGPLSVDIGWGYSEYTPMESDKLFVGPHDILAIVGAHEGKMVHLWFADEPINTAE